MGSSGSSGSINPEGVRTTATVETLSNQVFYLKRECAGLRAMVEEIQGGRHIVIREAAQRLVAKLTEDEDAYVYRAAFEIELASLRVALGIPPTP